MADSESEKVAKALLRLTTDPKIQERLNFLADKANSGTLSDSEQAEYRALVEAIDLLSISQAKARVFPDRQDPRKE